MSEALCLQSPAKVNLRLEILKKRDDGYHEIRTVFQKISLHDTLYFSLRKRKGISITTDNPDLPVGKTNLVHRAGHAFFQRAAYRGGLDVHIHKRIPLGAGLGGGSSNAAATLKALCQLLGSDLSHREMLELGLTIGADVPFFLRDGSAIATGVGEKLEKVTLPVLWYVLIYPNFEVSTRWAYQNSELTKNRFRLKIQKFLTTPCGILSILHNDLERVVSRTFPEIELMKGMLRSSGAMGTMVTGSGPTVFGLYFEEGGVLAAYRGLRGKVRRRGWAIFKAHSLSN